MTSKRGKPEIVFDILLAVRDNGGNIKPTRLLYKSNLSHARLKLYLDSLVTQELLTTEVKADKKVIKLTPKGYSFLDEYVKMKHLIESFGI
jgi:predicted transcriptional regulator